jgi:phage terminase large subunit GpA-like protein
MLLDDVIRRANLALVPPPSLRLSQWLEREFCLPDTSALPGRMKLWKYQVDIADAISDPTIERVTIVKATRIGLTQLFVGAIGGFVSNSPAPILVLQPTSDDARDFVVSDLEPSFSATPVLRRALSADRIDADRDTMTSKRFAGGSLKVIAAKAPRNLRRHTAKILLCDEVDAYEIGPEGSPVRLAERRTMSFPDRKIVLGSTPLFEDTSLIMRAYADSDMRIFEVPCPACGNFHRIKLCDIEWQPNQPETAAFRCPACKELISEAAIKPGSVNNGQWRATRPEVVGHAGFEIDAWVSLSPNAAWGKLIAEFLRAKEDPDELKTFSNTILAEPWREAGAEIDEHALQARAEDFGIDDIPAEVLFITTGTDVGTDFLATSIIGWGRGGCFVLDHNVIWGSPQEDDTWRGLDELLRTRWRHPLGGTIGVDAACVDSGYMTDRVYAFCFPRLSRKIMAIKGMAGPRPGLKVAAGKIKGGGRLFIAGVDTVKAAVFDKLQRGVGVRFSNRLEAAYYDELSSERRIVRYVRGQPIRRFERISGRAKAEALDALVYAHCARMSFNVSFEHREAALRGELLQRGSLASRLASSRGPARDEYGNPRAGNGPERDAFGRRILR